MNIKTQHYECNLMIILTIGIPASGKSTWARNYVRENPDTIRVCRDDLRLMIGQTQMLDSQGEKLVTKLVEHSIANKGKKTLIVDQTNCNLKYLQKLIDFASSFDSVKLVPFDITIEEAITRNNGRVAGRVPDDVMVRMSKGFEEVYSLYDFASIIFKKSYSKEIINYPIKDIRAKAVIFDIDGTLAHMEDQRNPFEWNKVGLDIVDEAVKDSLLAHSQVGKKIILLSGRDEICRAETEEWLKDNFIPYDHLYMRGVNDINKDFIIKEQLYREFIEPFYSVIAVYDDRASVIKRWREIGLKCFQVAEGDF